MHEHSWNLLHNLNWGTSIRHISPMPTSTHHHKSHMGPGSLCHCFPRWTWTESTVSWSGTWKQLAARTSDRFRRLSQSWRELENQDTHTLDETNVFIVCSHLVESDPLVNVENMLSRGRYMGVKHLKEPVNHCFRWNSTTVNSKNNWIIGKKGGVLSPWLKLSDTS